MTREIETWTEVHEKGDGRKVWNAGKPYRGLRSDEHEKTAARRAEARMKWVSEYARIVGYTQAMNALEGVGNE